MVFAKLQEPIKLPVKYDDIPRNERYLIRDQYQALQKGKCLYCQCDLDGEPDCVIASIDVNSDLFPSSFFKHPVHLHHNHDTGMTIGIVHAHCNAVMWEFDDE